MLSHASQILEKGKKKKKVHLAFRVLKSVWAFCVIISLKHAAEHSLVLIPFTKIPLKSNALYYDIISRVVKKHLPVDAYWVPIP